MTQIDKAAIVLKAKPVSLLIKLLALKNTDAATRTKTLNKYKAFNYKNYDGGFRTSAVYLHEGIYYCNLHMPAANSGKEYK